MRIDYYKTNPKAVNALIAVSNHTQAIDAKLKALVELRVSQINGCVYCVDLHTKQARQAGESQQKLDLLTVWEECPYFDAKEKAVLAWTEAVTRMTETHAPDEVFEELQKHLNEQEIVDLTLIVSLMNAWNRIAISFRKGPEQHR